MSSQPLKFLVGSNSSDISLISFTPSPTPSLSVIKSTSFTPTPSWVEASANPALRGKVFYCVSEEGGKVISFECGEGGELKSTGEAPTGGNPAHVHALKDGSGIVATNYMGGSAVYIPISPSTGAITASASLAQSILSKVTVNTGSVNPLLKFESPYGIGGGPNGERQEASHPHQCFEGKDGDLYVPDLGSDRLWQLKRKGEDALEVVGQADAKSGAGPRHGAIHPNGKYIYLITELLHELVIFRTPTPSSGASTQIHPNGPIITPSEIPHQYHKEMTSGELILSPNNRVLYISNRGQVDLNEKTGGNAKGDAIAIITLNEEGDDVVATEIVPTEINFIRGMSLTEDGKYLGVVGQKDGKVAVYKTKGELGEKIELVVLENAGLKLPTDVTWVQ